MSAQIPPQTRAEQIAERLEERRQLELARPSLRLSRTRRRIAVVATYATLAALLLMYPLWSSGPPDEPALMLWLVGGLIALAGCFTVVDYAVGGFVSKRDTLLDERERAIRDHATAVAYRALGTLVAAATVYVIFADLNPRWLPLPRSLQEAAPVGIAVIWLITSLPRAILAWTLPDPEPVEL
ncbi:MAG TPA: hypothetical protein VJT78_03055 [Candidatus Dormibacteraeota bacterium]|nr:hypothetical protein [Candidatus Dormibacteraeota bacterium]